MHAYNRTEADQTDSIAVCATREEWAEVAADLYSSGAPDLLLGLLIDLGVDVD